jgi:hypothetical protein
MGVLLLNCCVTDTKLTPCLVEDLHQPGEVEQRSQSLARAPPCGASPRPDGQLRETLPWRSRAL